MGILQLIKKAFTGGDWYIAIRQIGERQYHVIDNLPATWCADTLLFENAGQHYLFVEQYDKKKDKGSIGYYRINDGVPVNEGVVIDRPYHMSYPFVFEYEGNIYMIPENSANSTLDLYVAKDFPQKWSLQKQLLTGEKYVDSTVWREGDTLYVLAYKKRVEPSGGRAWQLTVFTLDPERQTLEKLAERVYSTNVGRPAGNLYRENGRLIRPAQDCSEKYGESIILYEVDDFNRDGQYLEHEIGRIALRDLPLDRKADRFHTYSRDSRYEAVDVYVEKLDLLHMPRIYLRSRRR